MGEGQLSSRRACTNEISDLRLHRAGADAFQPIPALRAACSDLQGTTDFSQVVPEVVPSLRRHDLPTRGERWRY